MTATPVSAPAPTDPANAERRALLSSILDEAIAAAHPRKCLVGHLPAPTPGRLIILGAGKAGGSMAAVASRFYRQEHGVPEDRIVGLAVARHGQGSEDGCRELAGARDDVGRIVGGQFASAGPRDDVLAERAAEQEGVVGDGRLVPK